MTLLILQKLLHKCVLILLALWTWKIEIPVLQTDKLRPRELRLLHPGPHCSSGYSSFPLHTDPRDSHSPGAPHAPTCRHGDWVALPPGHNLSFCSWAVFISSSFSLFLPLLGKGRRHAGWNRFYFMLPRSSFLSLLLGSLEWWDNIWKLFNLYYNPLKMGLHWVTGRALPSVGARQHLT